MQNPHSTALFASFQASLSVHPKLSRDMVFAVAKAVFDQFFASQPQFAAPQMMMTPSITGVAAPVGAAPLVWSRLLNTKEYGLPAFFVAETAALKAATPGLNHFSLVKQLRDQFEKTSRWSDYVNWVRSRHPQGATLKDPSPRKSETEKAPAAMAVPAMVPVPGAAIPVPGVVVQPLAPLQPVADQKAVNDDEVIGEEGPDGV